MSANKLQKERYYKLDECFRNTMHKWSLQLLLDAINKWLTENDKLGISKRTLQDDINFLKEVESAPIISYKEGRLNYFKYSDPSFTIKDKPISKEDEKNIRKAVNILRQLKGLSVADDLADTIQRLEQKTELDDELTSTVLQFEQNEHYTGREWFADTYEIMLQKKVIRLNYKPFTAKEAFTVHVHPYLLKQYNHRWFLIGRCEEYKNIGTYALDRFTEMRVSGIEFYNDPLFDSSIYEKHMLGISLPANPKPERIILEFLPGRAGYFLTKPFTLIDETIQMGNGNIRFILTMVINMELEAALLSFGKDVIVIEPSILRNTISGFLKEALKHYE